MGVGLGNASELTIQYYHGANTISIEILTILYQREGRECREKINLISRGIKSAENHVGSPLKKKIDNKLEMEKYEVWCRYN